MSPDTFVDTDKDSEDTLEEMFEKIPDYKFHQWKGTNANSLNKNRIHSHHERWNCRIRYSCRERVAQQYKCVKQMKDELHENHALIQMDFSKNCACQTIEEIQYVYWNGSKVTLHPTIIYFKDVNNMPVYVIKVWCLYRKYCTTMPQLCMRLWKN